MNNKLNRLSIIYFVSFLCINLIHYNLIFSPVGSQELNIIRIGTGSTAGTYFPVGGLIGNVISNPPGSRPCDKGGSCGVPGLIAVAQSTRGSIDNINLVYSGQMEVGLSQADVAYWAFNGSGYFQGQKPKNSIRALANLFPENIHIVSRSDSGINKIKDLVGKRVSIGGPRSGSKVDARLILSAYGIRFSDMKVFNYNLDRATRAIEDNTLDAFFLVSGAPSLAIVDLVDRVDINFVPVDGPIAEKLIKIFPFFVEGEIPEKSYGDNKPIKTLNVGALIITNSNMADDLAYGIVRAVWHPNVKSFFSNGHPRGQFIDIKNSLDGIGFKIHPGALNYYRDAGIVSGKIIDDALYMGPIKKIP